MAKGDCADCNWITDKKGWKCSECGDLFPCPGRKCGHVDCLLVAARNCHVCRKRIPNNSQRYYFLDGKGTTGHPVHKSCAEEDYYCVTVGKQVTE